MVSQYVTFVQFSEPKRGVMMTALAMPSDYEAPKLTKQLSARVRQSTHAKIANIREVWRALAREEATQHIDESAEEFRDRVEATVAAINDTHVVDVLLARATGIELAQFGGHASTPEKLAAQLKAIKTASKHQK